MLEGCWEATNEGEKDFDGNEEQDTYDRDAIMKMPRSGGGVKM
jgi:hypothetical protein